MPDRAATVRGDGLPPSRKATADRRSLGGGGQPIDAGTENSTNPARPEPAAVLRTGRLNGADARNRACRPLGLPGRDFDDLERRDSTRNGARACTPRSLRRSFILTPVASLRFGGQPSTQPPLAAPKSATQAVCAENRVPQAVLRQAQHALSIVEGQKNVAPAARRCSCAWGPLYPTRGHSPAQRFSCVVPACSTRLSALAACGGQALVLPTARPSGDGRQGSPDRARRLRESHRHRSAVRPSEVGLAVGNTSDQRASQMARGATVVLRRQST
jgi:hypothetical protein